LKRGRRPDAIHLIGCRPNPIHIFGKHPSRCTNSGPALQLSRFSTGPLPVDQRHHPDISLRGRRVANRLSIRHQASDLHRRWQQVLLCDWCRHLGPVRPRYPAL
ncbi:hypothetical protein LTR48_008804, partial [Friedmanniomyces endolithicus]